MYSNKEIKHNSISNLLRDKCYATHDTRLNFYSANNMLNTTIDFFLLHPVQDNTWYDQQFYPDPGQNTVLLWFI
ncbi:hypothetical protein [uncultured Shewanella sp.]|uniref:hypothetical protein n=1 Tax=uncultured Shewanella sp. TaxID=173975 RepID=UPI002619FBF4|nr:hypothetical protein [uncultured Shewanella sp.]